LRWPGAVGAEIGGSCIHPVSWGVIQSPLPRF
jgi:hypothetical protein